MATLSPQRPKSQSSSSDPFSMLRKEIDDLFSNFWGASNGLTKIESSSLAIDVIDNDKSLVVKLDAPGMKPDDFHIQVHGNVLSVTGERKEEKESKEKTYYKMERRYGSFARTVTLPCEVNDSEAAAEYSHGVLTLTLPKCEAAKPKKIPVKG
ncbi:MAG: Hsp20/alpha crystallin family protein [Pirellula sp.]|jgi:HSP20 family protein